MGRSKLVKGKIKMAKDAVKSPAAKPSASAGAAKHAPAEHGALRGYWVRHQGMEAAVVGPFERPSTAVEPGERSIVLRGPFATKEQAEERMARLALPGK